MNIYDVPLKDLTADMVKEEANKLASDPARKGELMDFFKIFGNKLDPKDKAEIITKSVKTERDWFEANLDRVKEKNQKIFDEHFSIKNGYLPDMPASHPQNVRTQVREMRENSRIDDLVKSYHKAKDYLEKHPDAIVMDRVGKDGVNMNMKSVRVMTKDGVVTVEVEKKLREYRGETPEQQKREAIKKQKKQGIVNNPLFKEEE